MAEIKLKVAEAVQDDVDKGIVRIDSQYMYEIGVRPGDFVKIKGERETVALVDRAYPGDIRLNYIRMDGVIRRNAKTGIGEMVSVYPAEIKEAKKVILAPIGDEVINAPPIVFKKGILGKGVMKGDLVSLGGGRRRKMMMNDSPLVDDVFGAFFKDNFFSFGLSSIKLFVAKTEPIDSAVVITDQTEVIYDPKASQNLEDEAQLGITYEDIGGLKNEIQKVREMIELPLKHPEVFKALGIDPPKGILLYGSPGTGKTLLAKAIASETNSNFYLINGPEIMSKYYGQSEANLRKKFEEAEKNAPSIIFIDEIDAIASKREDTHGEVEKRVVAQLLAIMDGLNARGRVVVVAATNLPNMLDPALRRPGRFDREIEISIPNLESREDILKIHTRSMPLHENVNLKKLAEVTHGFVGADLSALAKEAAMIVLRRLLPELENVNEGETLPQETLDKIRIAHEDFVEALKTVRPSAMREVFIEIPNVKWDDIGGVEESKERLKEVVEWPLKYPENFKKLGINPPKGVLLFGPPGTGKTLLAKAVANESQANFISIKGPEILNKWVGETEKAIRNIFEKARQTSPCVVFIDEIDSITPRRSASADSKVTEKIVNSILTEMDGVQELHNVMVIGATNRPDIVDPALLRPGRFDRLLFIDAPKEKGVEEILKIHTKNMPLDKDVNISELSKKLKGYTGADIAGLCREAVMHALRENVDCKKITENDFLEAIKEIRPSVTKEAIEAYKKIADKLKTAKADQVSDDQPNYYG